MAFFIFDVIKLLTAVKTPNIIMKKISLIFSFVALGIVTLLSACKVGCINGSGHAQTETRKPGSFSKLDIEGGYKIVLKQDSSESITITADDNLLKYIHTNISGGRLKIYSRKNFCAKGTMLLTIGVKHLDQLSAEGGIEINGDGKLNVQDLKMSFAGATKTTLDLSAANVYVKGSGSTELHISGQATSARIGLTGSGDVKAFDFVVGDYNVESTGAGDFEINVLHALKVNTTGASSVKYKGNPSTIQNDKSGSSSVTKVD